MAEQDILTHNEPSLDQLAESWLQHKTLEQSAQQSRLKVERRILEHADLKQKQDGKATTITKFNRKIVCKHSTNYRLDGTKLNAIRNELPAGLLPLEPKEVLVESRLKYLRNNEPEFYKEFSRCLISKPAKPSIKVEILETNTQP